MALQREAPAAHSSCSYSREVIMVHPPAIPGRCRRSGIGSVIVAAAALCSAMPLAAQQPLTDHTLTLIDGAPRVSAAIDDVAWIAGHWRGEALGGEVEEVWSPPFGGTMMGMFKLVRAGRAAMYEILHIAPDDGSLILRLKHFRPDLTGIEAQHETVDFRLVRLEPGAAYFDGMTFTRVDANTLLIHLALRRDTGVSEVPFLYHRSTGDRAAAPGRIRSPAAAQVGARAERTLGGFWLGAEWGLGVSVIDCAACPGERIANDPWEGGPGIATALAAGGTPLRNLELGGEFAYFRSFQEQGRLAELSYVGATARFYPAATSPVNVRAGIGLGTLDLSGAGTAAGWEVTEQAVAVRAAAAYDIRVARAFALVPAAGVTALITGGDAVARMPYYFFASVGLTRY
jgi:hypothetical protein